MHWQLYRRPKRELAPVPFFTDIRTLSQKLVADKREWRPTEPEFDCPNMIFGLVLELGEYYGKYREEPAPTMQLLTEDNIVWSVIGFHGYVRSEFAREQPQVGDFAAVAYLGNEKGEGGRVGAERLPDGGGAGPRADTGAGADRRVGTRIRRRPGVRRGSSVLMGGTNAHSHEKRVQLTIPMLRELRMQLLTQSLTRELGACRATARQRRRDHAARPGGRPRRPRLERARLPEDTDRRKRARPHAAHARTMGSVEQPMWAGDVLAAALECAGRGLYVRPVATTS